MHACTTITRSHLAFARVLARSFLQHHPESTFHALILDPVPGGGDREPFEALEPGDLLSPEEYGPVWFAYTPLELACAMKPRLLGHLLDRFGEGAVYLDADIRFYRPMDWLEGLLAEHAVVLTPHNVHPVPERRQNAHRALHPPFRGLQRRLRGGGPGGPALPGVVVGAAGAAVPGGTRTGALRRSALAGRRPRPLRLPLSRRTPR